MKIFPWILAIVFLGIIMFMRTCSPSPAPVVKIDTIWRQSMDTVHDSIPVPYQVEVEGSPVLITKTDTIIRRDTAKLTDADTMRVVQDWLAKRMYRDTLRNKYGYAVISNTVTQNKLADQSAIFSFNIPETHTIITEIKRKGYLGLDVGLGNQFAMGGLRFSYIDRKDNMFHLGADYTTGNFFLFSGGVDWKISLFK